MPYEVTQGAILEATIAGLFQDQRTLSVFHYVLNNADFPLDGVTAINDFDAAFNTNVITGVVPKYADAVSVNMTLTDVVYQWLTPVRRARVVKLPGITAGTVVGDQAPANLACALTKRSETAGRHGVGTLHMPGLTKDALDGGRFTIAGLDLYGGLLTKLFTAITLPGAQTMVPIIFNRITPANSVPITGAEANSTVRTMHRRTVGLGI